MTFLATAQKMPPDIFMTFWKIFKNPGLKRAMPITIVAVPSQMLDDESLESCHYESSVPLQGPNWKMVKNDFGGGSRTCSKQTKRKHLKINYNTQTTQANFKKNKSITQHTQIEIHNKPQQTLNIHTQTHINYKTKTRI